MYLAWGFRSYGPPVSSFLHGLLSTNIFEDHPIALSIIKDLGAILNTVSAARVTSNRAQQWVAWSACVGYQAWVLRFTKKESAASLLTWKDNKCSVSGRWPKCDIARVPWPWDPILGLINDLRAARTTFPAAALSRVRVLSFVYLFTAINDHIIKFVILLIVCRAHRAIRAAAFRSLS